MWYCLLLVSVLISLRALLRLCRSLAGGSVEADPTQPEPRDLPLAPTETARNEGSLDESARAARTAQVDGPCKRFVRSASTDFAL